MVDATKNRRGRPRVFSYSELALVDIDEKAGLLDRGLINRKYSEIGLDTVYDVINPDTDPDNYTIWDCFHWSGHKKQGVLEQIGRIKTSGLFSDEEIDAIVRQAVDDIQHGYKSKEIEKELRLYRTIKKREGKANE